MVRKGCVRPDDGVPKGKRIESGEMLAAVADELGIRRKLLYGRRDAFRAQGAVGFNRKRGPKAGSGLAQEGKRTEAEDLAQARARIAELERVIGRRQVDLDFFREALRLMDATPPGIASKSTRSSKR